MSAPTWTRRHLALAGAISALAGCGRSDDEVPARLTRITPTHVPTPPLTARADRPLEARRVQGPHFSLAIPAGWTDRELPKPRESVRLFAYDAQGRPPERPVRIGVAVEDPADQDSIEQAHVLVVAKTAAGAQDVRSSMVSWPDARRGVLVDWVETQSGAAETPYRTRQLMAQVSARVIVNVVGTAPADEYADLGLDAVIETLRLST